MILTLTDGKSRRIAMEAANWRAEMEEPASVAQIEAFEAWLTSDSAHLAAYRDADDIAKAGTRLPSMAHYLERSARVVRHHPVFAIAAMVALVLGTWGLIRDPDPAYAAITNRGQATRIVALSDGSVIALDRTTMLEVAVPATDRHIKMSSGRARFVLRRATDIPLRVTTSLGEVISKEGVFDVAVDSDVRVWMISGKAAVTLAAAGGSASPRSLNAGEGLRLLAGATAATPIQRPDTSWPDARVAFDQAPLAWVLRRANRRGQPTIAITGDATGKLLVTGVLDVRDTRKLARKLAAALGLELTETDNALLLSN